MPNAATIRQPLDCSPIHFCEFTWKGERYPLRSPLVFNPHPSESGDYLVIDDESWNVHLLAPTRDLLLDELSEQFGVMWSEYACESDEALTQSARELKARLLSSIGPR